MNYWTLWALLLTVQNLTFTWVSRSRNSGSVKRHIYTVFTVTGSVLAHYIALKTEKGKAAVGANAKYAQITTEEWKRVKGLVDEMFSGEPYE